MALIEWNAGLSVDVAEFDSQHQKLIKLINDLNDAMKTGKGKDVLGKIILDLANYTVNHFSAEEHYFDKFGYPATVDHKLEHKKFIAQVGAFKNDFESGHISMTIKVMDFLSDWLRTHIMGTDKKYSQFFNENGLK